MENQYMVDRLIGYLEAKIEFSGEDVLNCSNEMYLTENYLSEAGLTEDEIESIMVYLNENGAFCDCEILFNVA